MYVTENEKQVEDISGNTLNLKFYCDDKRHLVCIPYSIENLHKMGELLSLKRCWFHNKKGKEHYDIPKKRVKEIQSKCQVVDGKEILKIIKQESHGY